MKERNDVHGDEETLEQLRRKPEPDPEDDAELEREFWQEVAKELSAQYFKEIVHAATQDLFAEDGK